MGEHAEWQSKWGEYSCGALCGKGTVAAYASVCDSSKRLNPLRGRTSQFEGKVGME